MASSSTSVRVAVMTLLIALLCVMIAAFVYVIAIDGIVSCFDLGVRWSIALLIDFSIYVVIFGAWFFYKESSCIKTAVFIALMFTLGSVATTGYILIQFFKLSTQESSKNPLYFVLVRRHKKEHTWGTSVVTARIVVYALGSLMMGALIYTLIVDISASHVEAFSLCFPTYMVDIYIHAVLLSVWIAYKESSWLGTFLWILSLICFGNVATCVYIVRQLVCLSSEQHVSLIIFNSNDIYLQESGPLLVSHADV